MSLHLLPDPSRFAPDQALIRKALVAQNQIDQAMRWKHVLESQHIQAIIRYPHCGLVHLLNFHEPDVLILDLDVQHLNPYDICRHCRYAFPEMGVILTYPDEAKISAHDRYWALYQGAHQIIPCLNDFTPLVVHPFLHRYDQRIAI